MDFVVKEYEAVSAKIARTLSIVLLSDLHNTEHGSGNADLIRAVRKCSPDLILCAGDMLVGRPGASFLAALDFMQAMAETAPVFASNGNHETRMRLYTESYGPAYDIYTAALRKAGVHVLCNENCPAEIRGSHLRIYGLEIPPEKYKKFSRPLFSLGEMNALLGSADESSYSILLAHNPQFAETYGKWGADLTVSGHFHGGVMRLANGRALLNPYGSILPKYGYGSFYKGSKRLIVTSGAGEHVIPFRINNPMEMVHITLR